jgi:hypothetical protein
VILKQKNPPLGRVPEFSLFFLFSTPYMYKPTPQARLGAPKCEVIIPVLGIDVYHIVCYLPSYRLLT